MAALQQYIANKTPNLKFQNYLSASELFLQQGNFEDCRIYALKAIEIDPNQIAPSQILFTANILLMVITTNNCPNHYFILNLPLYAHNQELIKNNFMYVSNLLNPIYNPYPFASEALGYALTSWTVLSSLTQKASFDEELRSKEKEKNTFEPNPEYLWPSFVGTSINKNNVEFGTMREKTNEKNDVNNVIEISDDEEEVDNRKRKKFLMEEEKLVESNGGEVDKEEGNLKKKRIKMMAKSLNKVLGKGNKVDMNKIDFGITEDNNAASEIVGTQIYDNIVDQSEIAEGKTHENDNVGEMTDIEFGIVKDNNVESGIVGKKSNDNSNVGETTNNNFKDKSMEDDDFDEYLREDIYDQMKKFYDIEFF